MYTNLLAAALRTGEEHLVQRVMKKKEAKEKGWRREEAGMGGV